MSKKKLAKVTLFVSGEPENDFPDRAFVSYVVKAGKAETKQKVHEIDDLDPSTHMSELFAEALAEIKNIEGVA